MSLPELQNAIVSYHKVNMWIDSGEEAIHLVKVAWWLEELKFKIKLCERFLGETASHMVTLKPLVHQDLAKGRIRSLLGLPDSTTLEDHLFMECFNILIWNCRGAGNDNFKRNFRDIINQHKPEVVALLETKIDLKSMGMFFKDLGLTAATHVDPNGRAGGIWILWDPSKVSLNTTHKTSHVIHTTVQKDNFEDWIFSAVYGSPNPRICEILWEELSHQAGSNQQPWLLAGDFNDTIALDESKSLAPDTVGTRP